MRRRKEGNRKRDHQGYQRRSNKPVGRETSKKRWAGSGGSRKNWVVGGYVPVCFKGGLRISRRTRSIAP